MCRNINRLLDHAIIEKDMVEEEKIIFHGETNEFIKLIRPLLSSRRWKVNETSKQKKFLRVIDEVIKIRYDEKKEYLKFDSLIAATKEYFEKYFPTDTFS